jgi:type IV pilus assembly protein PilB
VDVESLVKDGSLGSVLIRSQIITEEDIKSALEEQKRNGGRFGEALVRLGIVTREDIDWALSTQLNIPYIRLKPEMIDRDAVQLVPASLARKYNLIPLFRNGDELSVALADPLDRSAIGAVEQVSGCRVTPSIPVMRELREMQDLFYGTENPAKIFGFSTSFFPAKILDSINRDISGARFLDYMLLYVLKNKLSSLSLQPLGEVVAVIGRQGDVSREIGRLATDNYPVLLMHMVRLGKMKPETDISARGTLNFQYDGQNVPFQILSLKGRYGDYITLKIHNPVRFPARIGELAAGEDRHRFLREMLSAPDGIVLFSSAARDNCSRLIDLYLDEYDTSSKTVMVLGDGAGKGKKRFPCVSARKSARREMSAVVSAILEHDPDILVIEDLADSRDFIAAYRAARQGKLVLCGISCGDMLGVLHYLMRLKENIALLSNFKGIISLRTGSVPCPHCSRTGVSLGGSYGSSPPFRNSSRGCSLCGNTGFSGEKFLVDIVPFTSELRNAFLSAGNAEDLLRLIEQQGGGAMLKEWDCLAQTGHIVPGGCDAHSRIHSE